MKLQEIDCEAQELVEQRSLEYFVRISAMSPYTGASSLHTTHSFTCFKV